VSGLITLAVVSITGLLAQRPVAPAARPQFTSLDCTFTAAATTTWPGSQPTVRTQQDTLLGLRIRHLDAAGGSAEVMLGALTTPTLLVANGDTMHFIEPPVGGETAITSIYAPAGARYRASHSRTTYYRYSGPGFTSTPQAEQYYGYCVPARD
jgi:hypothetical protein